MCEDCRTDMSATTEDVQKLRADITKLFSTKLDTLDKILKQSNEKHSDQLQQLSKNIESIEGAEKSPTLAPPEFHQRIPSFNGESDDPILFLDRFTLYAKLCKWTDEQSLIALPLCFNSSAQIWHSALGPDAYTNLQDFIKLFQKRFLNENQNFMLRQKLQNRKQSDTETVENYAAAIGHSCLRLGIKDDTEKMHIFISGLRPHFKNHVILNNPKTMEEALNLARLKSGVPEEHTLTLKDFQLLQNSLINELKSSSLIKPAVSAVDRPADQNNDRRIRQIIREELRASRQNYSQPPRNFNRRGDFGNQNNFRTVGGQIICSNCHMTGHHYSRCRRPRFTDPRVPRDRRQARGSVHPSMQGN